MELSELVGPQWAGWSIGEDGLIYAPGWRKGLDRGEILAMPYIYAQVAEYRRKAAAAELARVELETLCHQAERLAHFYRSQLILESRFGLMLARVAG